MLDVTSRLILVCFFIFSLPQQLYSPAIDIFWRDVKPIIDNINAVQSDGEKIVNVTALLNQDSGQLVEKLQGVVRAFNATTVLLPKLGILSQAATASVQYILEHISERMPATIQEVEVYLLFQQITSIMNALGDPGAAGGFSMFGSSPIAVQYVRGGIEGNYTSPFYEVDPGGFIQEKQQILEMPHPFQFQQYLILSDGNGVGSTANTFQVRIERG